MTQNIDTSTDRRPDGTDPHAAVDQTPVGVAVSTPNVAAAVETVASHLHPTPSWDVADHPMPTGREEIWRFSPIRALRPLLTDAPSDARLQWDEHYPEGVTTRVVHGQEARDLAVEAPVDRVSALAADGRAHV